MHRAWKIAALNLGLLGLAGVAGCRNAEQESDVKTAEQAVGVQDDASKTVTEKRDLIVRKDVEVVDPKTGKVLKRKVTETPVTIERREKTDVKVDVGETAGEGQAKPPGR